jgi:hypothetical protein
VQQGRAFGEGWVLHIHQMVPAAPDGPDFMVTAEPVEAVQVEPGCGVDVLRREGSATAAVEQHQGAPVLLGVSALHFTEELLGFAGLVIVLHAEQGEVVVALGPELGDVAATEHVAVHKDRPALVAHQVGNQKACKGKGCALLGVSFAPVEPLSLQLGRNQGGYCQGSRAVLNQTVNKDIGCSALSRIRPNKYMNRIHFTQALDSNVQK